MEEVEGAWANYTIKDLYVKPVKEIFESILSRFEILDIREEV